MQLISTAFEIVENFPLNEFERSCFKMELLQNSDYQDPITILWRIYKTSLEMLADRGYEVPEPLRRNEQELRIMLLDDKETVKTSLLNLNKLRYTLEHTKKEKGTMSVFFMDVKPTINLDAIRDTLQLVASQNDKVKHRTIIISSTNPTAAAKKLVQLEDLVELFLFSELSFNVTQHSLVPKHEVMGRNNKQLILRKLNVKENQLPKISTQDPVARYYRITKGKLVKITRSPCGFTEEFVTYRIVVD